MRTILTALVIITFSTALAWASDAPNSWNGITPLVSTRRDVVAKFGDASEKDCSVCSYSTSNERIRVSYSTGQCTGSMTGWAVALDTVLRLSVSRTSPIRFDTEYDRSKMLGLGVDSGRVRFVDQVAGREIVVDNREMVVWETFLPLIGDNTKRCDGYAPYNPFGAAVQPTLTLTKMELMLAKQSIDAECLAAINAGPGAKVYVLTYTGNGQPMSKYRRFVRDLRKAIFDGRGYSPQRIEFIDGGTLESFRIDLFALSANSPRPVPNGIKQNAVK